MPSGHTCTYIHTIWYIHSDTCKVYLGYTRDTHVGYAFTLAHLEHTHSINHRAHSHLHILGTGRVHIHRLICGMLMQICVCGHTWLHITITAQSHTHRAYWDAYSDMLIPPGHTFLSLRYISLRIYLDKQPSHLETYLNTPMGHTHMPTHPYGTHSDTEHILLLGPASCPSLPSEHNSAPAPSGGPLSLLRSLLLWP